MNNLNADVVVIGGGMGGVAAALAALRAGRRVILTEQYEWLGGQLTSQAVPMDEHTWVEQFGVTASYRELREGIRGYYRENYPLTAQARAERHLNPGAGLVSRLCAEPRVAVAVIDAMLAPYIGSSKLTIMRGVAPISAEVDDTIVTAVLVRDIVSQAETRLSAPYILDATELGDLLPLTGAEYVTGTESRGDTGEPSAPEHAAPDNVQAFSWCFVVDHQDGIDNTIEKPRDYDYWSAYQPEFWGAPIVSLTAPHPRTLEIVTRAFTPTIDDDPFERIADQRAGGGDDELWIFRRILSKKMFEAGHLESDVVMVNWPMIDYLDGNLIDSDDADAHLDASRQLSLSMFYWLQTEAPRPDGGKGWPGLRLRGDVTGTSDGLAQAPYIRESRRIVSEYRVVEGDLSIAVRGHGRPATFPDTVGVGMYRIDLHPSTGGDNYIDVASAPFEIPLGALIPVRLDNLLPAGKNVGTTHITNGAFRLHPVEWNIGESAGWLAAFCLDREVDPRTVRNTPQLLEEFQTLLTRHGVELHWPDVTGY
ncbi:FAD-dependent oxidoreductase [Salinibacterium sp. SWN1162]|uniref:FAD-dependent oxidoreductase n=1 Tax=Salinibacterium sp. SWN1162 TaxID=2792053 RepID=UPI0018CF2A9A|nr:FAD-dependent oxidoreductase [Salinibacterium sp. SWN1162]MBH0007719.1 FAD-dependent oxidoreductase [Salinibacterium sp. SWN1162]